MAYASTHSDLHATRPGLFTRTRAALARGFARWIEVNSRADRVAALQAKSDAELAALGLRRDDIVQYVFRDRMIF
ncbi:hypothetical protein [Palleronia abyssalis]|uniref:DUF1127 domain-containing protein n=1 Tax=Palleronia abyssalis TaxID=1501240 RepID=A0A2R8BZA6_9RHOB|nr:hypothetical protein [Palleronia abyssalis]SPJ25482.1 hypothetical protein PAA8504_03333 [Palleronia abyssalis]